MDKEDTSLLLSENSDNDEVIENDASTVPSSPIAQEDRTKTDPANLVICPKCHIMGPPRTKTKLNAKTHLVAGLLCILGCPCLACVPYLINNCKNRKRYCQNCNEFLSAN